MRRAGAAPGAAWLVVAAGVSGVSTYVLLAVAAAGLGVGFDLFSVFWSFLMIAVIGGFLPLEQVAARRVAGGQAPATLVRALAVWGAVVVVVATAGFWWLWDGGGGVVLVLAAAVTGMVPQGTVRGVASGRQDLRAYGLVLVTDSSLRALACGALAVAGSEAVVAYAAAVAASAWVAAAVGAVALRLDGASGQPTTDSGSPSLAREAGSVAAALLGMQLVLNSPVVLADAMAAASAGTLLAATSLARVPVLAVQVLQASYVARIAGFVAAGDQRARTWCRAVAVLSWAAAGACLLGMVVLGPWLVALLFGDRFAPDRTTCAVVGAGIGLFLVATVANDLAVAVGRFRWVGATWLVSVLAGAAVLAVVPSGADAPLVPLVVASGVAAAALTWQRRPALS